MKFTKFAELGDEETEFPIFKLVQDGKITEINKKIQTLQQGNKQSEILDIICRKDNEGKTPLHYAWYAPLPSPRHSTAPHGRPPERHSQRHGPAPISTSRHALPY